jgi:hypothetical protein
MGKLADQVRSQWAGFLALFLVVAGGSAWAAGELGKNDVASKHIKRGAVKTSDLAINAVVSEKVANGSLKQEDFGADELPVGPQGPEGPQGSQGPQGQQGPPGEPATRLWATVRANGTIIDRSDPAIQVASFNATDSDYFIDFGRDISDCAASVQIGDLENNVFVIPGLVIVTRSAPTRLGVDLRTTAGNDAGAANPFSVMVFC